MITLTAGTVSSADGTTIGYESVGRGPVVVLVDGAMCYRAFGPMRPLASLLAEHFTVYAYDRRGRGESGDTPPYAVAREVEDVQAVIGAAGGQAYLYGISSGAALAMAAAAAGSGITKLALYEPPYVAEIEGDARAKDYTEHLHELLAQGRRGDAVEWFMTYVGVPGPVIAGMRAQPTWRVFETIAPTLAYDNQALTGGRVPHDVASAVRVPTLVLAGGDSPQNLQQAARVAADALASATVHTLPCQTHDVSPAALAPALVEFYSA
ncbi:MAG TPA: alpha/beta hydrolase [Micromonosporaceae bacterium]